MKTVIIKSTCSMLAGSEMNMRGNYDSSTVTIGSRRGGSNWDDDEEE